MDPFSEGKKFVLTCSIEGGPQFPVNGLNLTREEGDKTVMAHLTLDLNEGPPNLAKSRSNASKIVAAPSLRIKLVDIADPTAVQPDMVLTRVEEYWGYNIGQRVNADGGIDTMITARWVLSREITIKVDYPVRQINLRGVINVEH